MRLQERYRGRVNRSDESVVCGRWSSRLDVGLLVLQRGALILQHLLQQLPFPTYGMSIAGNQPGGADPGA